MRLRALLPLGGRSELVGASGAIFDREKTLNLINDCLPLLMFVGPLVASVCRLASAKAVEVKLALLIASPDLSRARSSSWPMRAMSLKPTSSRPIDATVFGVEVADTAAAAVRVD